MGDRATLAIRSGPNVPLIGIYVHWAGSELPEMVEKAIANAKPRWHDESYSTRMIMHSIFEQVTEADDQYGCGVTVFPNCLMSEHPTIVVDVRANSVWIASNDELQAGMTEPPADRHHTHFDLLHPGQIAEMRGDSDE